MTIEQFTKDFPAVSRFSYLNTAASGLLSEGLMEWRQNHDIDFLIGGSEFRINAQQSVDSVRGVVSNYFSADVTETFLTPNFTFALKTLVQGMDKNQSVLLLEDDYPSLYFPFKSSGFKQVNTIGISSDVEESILQSFEKKTPDIFAFSVVQYISGIQLDLNFIKHLKKQYPQVIFVADATQYSGVEHFSFEDSGIDVYGGSGYKWLLAGYGNAYMLVKENLQDHFFKDAREFEHLDEPFLKSKSHLQIHLESGHLDTLNIGSLGYSLQQFNAIGQNQIQNHIAAIVSYAKEQLLALGCLGETIQNRTQKHSSIFNIQISPKQSAALAQHNIIYSNRGGGARLSFHLYNTVKDVDKVVKLLRKHQE